MGNHSSRTEEDEEIDHNPYQIIHPQSSNQTTFTRKLLFFFPISIYKITKYLLQKLWRKREKPDPLLPTQNPKTNRHSPHIPPHSKPAYRTFQYQTGRVERPTPVWTRPVSSEEEKGKTKEGVVVVPTAARYSTQIPPTAVAADQKFQIQTGRVVKSTPGSVVGKRETEGVVPTRYSPQIPPTAVAAEQKFQIQTGRVVKSTPGSVVGKRETEGVVPTRRFPQIASRDVVVDVDPKPQFHTGRVIKPIPENLFEQIPPPPSIDLDYEFQSQTGSKSSRKKGKWTETLLVLDEGKWITHYSNRHRILVVGDGDFSFSVSLAVVFESAANMIATSKDSKGFLKRNYAKAQSNLKELGKRGCKVMNGIDATTMADHELLGQLKFDRIVYNFPHAGFFKDMTTKDQLRLHRNLVKEFLKNAKEMLSENGEIHISHKANGFHKQWKIVSLASEHKLKLIEAVDFSCDDYPGYYPKYGFGGDKNFDCDPSKTYKFGREHKLKLIEAVDFSCDDYPGYYPKYGFGGDKNFDCCPSKTYKFGHNGVWY